MEEVKNFLNLQNHGRVLFLYADSHHLYAVYHDQEDSNVYQFTMTKHWDVVSVVQVENAKALLTARSINWHRPKECRDNPRMVGSGSWSFAGNAQTPEGEHIWFEIDPMAKMTVRGTSEKFERFKINSLSCLEHTDVEHHIQKKNLLYVTGVDTRYKEQVFLVVDIAKDKAQRRYHLRSDVGDLNIATLTIDHYEAKVYVGGSTDVYDSSDRLQHSLPYVDGFHL